MGKKHDRKKKTKVTLSLADFNGDAGTSGLDPELAALPSAPKAAEDWEKEGGRPEYNSRGYKERRSDAYGDGLGGYADDAEFDERDWSRKGPMDSGADGDGDGFGGGPERSWDGMRRGPMDAIGGDEGAERDWNGMRRGPMDALVPEGGAERSWDGIRRGPVDAEFAGGDAGGERDWSMRKGPVEAEGGPAAGIDDASWGAARRGPVDAEFPGEDVAERDWTQRKGPVEAEGSALGAGADVNWGDARKRPVDAEFSGASGDGAERDWTQRKGPVEAETSGASGAAMEQDWTGARKGPLDTDVDSAKKAMRDLDFSDMRRGAKLQELEAKPSSTGANAVSVESRPDADGGKWRREVQAAATAPTTVPQRESWSGARRGPLAPVEVDTKRRSAPLPRAPVQPAGPEASQGDARDWGAARRTQPLRTQPRQARATSMATGRQSNDTSGAAKGAVDDDWTTVRSAATQRRAPVSSFRRGANTGSRGRGGDSVSSRGAVRDAPSGQAPQSASATAAASATVVPAATES